MKKKEYYFDNNATTCYIEQDIIDTINKWLSCGNPSNTLYKCGKCAHKQNQISRNTISEDLDVLPKEIYFTSNATEANNIAIQSIINYYLAKSDFELTKSNNKYTIITSNAEHPSVLEIFKQYKNNPKINVVFIPVETNIASKYFCSITPESLKKTIEESKYKIILVSIMYANNETGALSPIKEIGEMCNNNNIVFHCDATQAIGKYIIHPKELKINALTFSGHKIHTPKGVGCLFFEDKIKFNNNTNITKCDIESKNLHGVCFGGEQTLLRPGTENISFNAALSLALKKIHENREKKNNYLLKMKNKIIDALKNDTIILNPINSIPTTIYLLLKNISCCNKDFVTELSNKYNICVGVSSSCQTIKKSHILEALKIPELYHNRTLRISMCDYTTEEDCDYLIDKIKILVKHFYKKD